MLPIIYHVFLVIYFSIFLSSYKRHNVTTFHLHFKSPNTTNFFITIAKILDHQNNSCTISSVDSIKIQAEQIKYYLPVMFKTPIVRTQHTYAGCKKITRNRFC